MKKLFEPGWLAGVLANRTFLPGKKTPWYRKSPVAGVPWLAGLLMAPLALFLLWKAIAMLRSRGSTQRS